MVHEVKEDDVTGEVDVERDSVEGPDGKDVDLDSTESMVIV